MERYEGVRFETDFVDRRPPVTDAAVELLLWCKRFVAYGLASGGEDASGNLSVRLASSFLITPTHVPLDVLEADDLVEVLEVEPQRVRVVGTRVPSSECRLHDALYRARAEVRAVFHGHAEEIVQQGPHLGLSTTPREVEYGSQLLADLAVDAARGHDFVILHSHGFVSLGRSAGEAGRRALAVLAQVRSRAGPPTTDLM